MIDFEVLPFENECMGESELFVKPYPPNSAWRIRRLSVPTVQSNLNATAQIAAHCDLCRHCCPPANRIVHSRTSGDNLFALPRTQSSQRFGSPANLERFNFRSRRIPRHPDTCIQPPRGGGRARPAWSGDGRARTPHSGTHDLRVRLWTRCRCEYG